MNDTNHVHERATNRADRRTRIGDRVVQVVLLAMIAGGIVMITRTLAPSDANASGPAGGPPAGAVSGRGAMGGMGGRPGGAGLSATADEGATTQPVSIVAVELETVRETIRVNGDVETTTSVSIYPDAGGKIVDQTLSVGDAVAVGSTIAVVDPSIPGQRYEMSDVLSTINGTITAISAQVGATVSTQTPVATIGNLRDLEIVTFVPERFVDAVTVGLVADVTFEAFPDETFAARVVEVSPVLDATSRTIEVSLVPTATDPRIKVGMFASIELVVREAQNVATVPAEAITAHYGDDVVYVYSEATGSVERRTITTGLESPYLAEVVEGVAEGEFIVIAGLSNITDGATVRVVE